MQATYVHWGMEEWIKKMTKIDSILESRDYFSGKYPSNQRYGFSSSHIWMWELDYKESRRIDAFELYVREDSWESLGLQGDPTSPS